MLLPPNLMNFGGERVEFSQLQQLGLHRLISLYIYLENFP